MRKKYVALLIVGLSLSLLIYFIFIRNRVIDNGGVSTIKIAGHTSQFGAPVKIAESKGLFAKHGLNASVRLVESSRESMAAMEAGDFDVVMGTLAAGNLNTVHKGDLVILADAGRALPIIIVRQDLWDGAKIKQLTDLKGKTVVTPREGSASSYALARVLQGVNLKSEDIISKFLSDREALAALESKQIDAAVLSEPDATNAIVKGIGVKIPSEEIQKYFPPNGQQYMVIYTRRKTLTEKADTLRRFLAAYMEAVGIYSQARNGKQPERDEVVTVISQFTGGSKEVVDRTTWQYVAQDGKPDTDFIRQMQDFFVRQKLVDSPVDLSTVVHLELLTTSK